MYAQARRPRTCTQEVPEESMRADSAPIVDRSHTRKGLSTCSARIQQEMRASIGRKACAKALTSARGARGNRNFAMIPQSACHFPTSEWFPHRSDALRFLAPMSAKHPSPSSASRFVR